MQRLLLIILICTLAALPSVHAVPARLPNDATARPTLDPFDLHGSRWSGSDIESGDWEITFEKDGGITYTYNGRTFRNGSWKWQGNALYFETNQKYYEFRGMVLGDVIDGESHNVKGVRWHTSMYRIAASK